MLEQVVRPFARTNTLATTRIVATAEKVEVNPAVISWGVVGTLPGAQEIEQLDGGFEVITCDDTFEEVGGLRKSDTKRITQKDANGNEIPENFVDVERPYQVTYDKVARQPNYDKTTTWNTNVEMAGGFETTDIDDKKCRSTYNISRPA